MAKKNKTNVIGTKAALAKLDRMMPILEKNVLGALRIEATLEVGNDTIRKMTDKDIPGAGAYNTIKQSLSFDLAMHIARLFDKGSGRYHANHKDAASIPLMIRLLRQKRCRRMLADRARMGDDLLADLFERDCLKALDKASKAYSATFRGKFGQSGLKHLKIARDHHFAHSLMSNKKLKLIYNQLFRLADCAKDILDHASIAITGKALQPADLEQHFREEADEFWTHALLGKVAEE